MKTRLAVICVAVVAISLMFTGFATAGAEARTTVGYFYAKAKATPGCTKGKSRVLHLVDGVPQ